MGANPSVASCARVAQLARASPCQGEGRGFESPLSLRHRLRPGGGIGIRAGLKIQWPHGLEGSSPSPGTLMKEKINSFFTPQFQPAKSIEKRIKTKIKKDRNQRANNWCGMCCLSMILKALNRKIPSLSQLYKQAFGYGVYKLKDGCTHGACHQELAEFITKKFKLKARAIQNIKTQKQLINILRSNDFFIASVTPEIRDSPKKPTKKQGHLILVFNCHKIDNQYNLTFHNSVGFTSNNSQKSITMPINKFFNYFSGRGLKIKV